MWDGVESLCDIRLDHHNPIACLSSPQQFVEGMYFIEAARFRNESFLPWRECCVLPKASVDYSPVHTPQDGADSNRSVVLDALRILIRFK